MTFATTCRTTKLIRMLSSFSVMVVMILLFAGSAAGQVTASISGTVSDETKAGIPGATVTVKSTETGAVRVVTTDEAGNYRVLALPVGAYQLTAEKEGFTPELQTGINLTI